MRKSTRSITVAWGEGDARSRATFNGRDAWALCELLKAGDVGCTPIENPGPRWSAYVLKLRRAGLVVETVTENHGGPFAGHHARYVLRTAVRTVEDQAVAA